MTITREHPLDMRPELAQLRADAHQERWMIAAYDEAPLSLDAEPRPVVYIQGPRTSSHGMEVVPIEDLADALRIKAEAVCQRDKWVRLFNRLQGAVQHHKNAHDSGDYFPDVPDEALWKAMERILAEAAAPQDKEAHDGR